MRGSCSGRASQERRAPARFDLSDALEAVVAAIYLDSDYPTCRAVVLPWFAPGIAAAAAGAQGGQGREDPAAGMAAGAPASAAALRTARRERREEHARHFVVRCALADADIEAHGEAVAARRRAAGRRRFAGAPRGLGAIAARPRAGRTGTKAYNGRMSTPPHRAGHVL